MVQGQVFSGTPLQTMDKKSNHKQEIIKIANQLNALIKITKFVGFEEKKLIVTFIQILTIVHYSRYFPMQGP